jgi:hypothetical protein
MKKFRTNLRIPAAILLLCALLLTLTGCAPANEEPLVKKGEIVKMVDLNQVPTPKTAGTYNIRYNCPVTDPDQFGKAFFGDRPYRIEEGGYGYRVVNANAPADRPKEFVMTHPSVRGMKDGQWIGNLQTDCAYITYGRDKEPHYADVFRHALTATQGQLKWALRSPTASAEVLQEAEADSARILRTLGVEEFELTFSGGYSPEAFDQLARMVHATYPELPGGHVYVAEYQFYRDGQPASFGMGLEAHAHFVYDETGLKSATIGFDRVAELTGSNPYVPCSAAEAYEAAVAEWHEPGAILVDAYFFVQPNPILEPTLGESNATGEGEGYWKFVFLYPARDSQNKKYMMEQLGPYRECATGCYSDKTLIVSARTGERMTGLIWNSFNLFGRCYIHSYNNWGAQN